MKPAKKILFSFMLCILFACSSPSNKRAISLDELDKTQEDELKDAPPAPVRDALSATELMALAACSSLPCVQQFMKDYSADFIHATRGEFAALHRSIVVDTTGDTLVMPLSTIYVDVNPQADWRMAHTLHRADLGNRLMEEFKQIGYVFLDSGYFLGLKNKQARFTSPQYPGRTLYVTSTYEPWRLKGLYKKVTWPCFVFEIYNDR